MDITEREGDFMDNFIMWEYTASFCKMAVSSKLMRNNICPLWKETTGSPEDQNQNTLDYGFSEDNTTNAAPNCRMS